MNLTRRELCFKFIPVVTTGLVLAACGPKQNRAPSAITESAPVIDPEKEQLQAEVTLAQIYNKVISDNEANNSYGIEGMPSSVPPVSVLTYVQENDVLIPALVASQPLVNAIPEFVQANSVGLTAFLETNLVNFFHWVNHSKDAGLEVTQLFRFLQMVKNGIVEPCLRGDPGTLIFSRSASSLNGVDLKGVYMFVNRVGGLANQWVAIVDQESGALITAYDSSLNGNNVATAKEALKTISREINRGASQTVPSMVNQNVRNIWQSTDPKTFTNVMLESLKYAMQVKLAELGYQLKDIGGNLASVLRTLPNKFTLFAVPAMVFCETPNIGDIICPANKDNKIID
ncbi:MAG TPA: hypothetical protein PK639_00970 [Candidatus Woesebacteria bacterium]|nr:hypothetical protein [Candidatus Woesebacteria bacterium]